MYNKNLITILKSGGIGVLATDTLYGIVTSALQKDAVEKIYQIKKRDFDKPFIILLASLDQLKSFGVNISEEKMTYLRSVWPGKVSVVLPVVGGAIATYQYLHRSKNALAFRVPAKKELRELLLETGPLVAPSANVSAQPPATTIGEAKSYFGDRVDIYVDEGLVQGDASRLIDYTKDMPIQLR